MILLQPFANLTACSAQIIRNGGGRVTTDVLRSLLVTQDILHCNTIMVIHHTDCGAQARQNGSCTFPFAYHSL